MTTGNRPIKEVLVGIIVQVSKLTACYFKFLISKEVEFLSMYLTTFLEHRRYMIVLHDVRHVEKVNYWRMLLPDKSDGSLVILTTSSLEIAQLSDWFFDPCPPVAFVKEAILLFVNLVNIETQGMRISRELVEVGRKIVENCRGLPISAFKTLLFLSKSEKTVEQWSKIAADKENPIFKVADEVSEMCRIVTEIQSDDRIRHINDDWISSSVENSVKNIMNTICPERFFSKMQIISLLGMASIGKSTLATKIFKDQSSLRCFEHHVWVTLGPKYQTEKILIDILAQIYPDIDKFHIKGDEKLARELCAQLSSKRCLIVLDDLWSQEPLHDLKNLFPDICGTTLVTTRLARVAKFGRDDTVLEMQLLDEEESWCLLCQKVFGEEGCPPHLEKAGRKIAEKCDRLPLLIVKVAEELLKVSISEEYWNNVASGKEKSVFMNAHHQISKILLPSYQRLPQYLKPCFLYMGVFCEKYEIPISKLTNMLTAEGFLETNLPQTEEDFIAECLLELLRSTLVMVQRKVSDSKIKTCRLHSVFWHLSNSEALKNRFFHAMNIYDDCSIESIQSQRRLCIRNSTLLGMKDVQISMASNTSAHSLLCVNPFHQYPVPIIFDWRLLRVMNALTIRLYEFPVEVVRLVHLRYLGLTCNGNLPTSISNLWKLQYLIVKRYVHIKSSQNSWPLPAEIWDMKELQHLQVMGGCLPDHKCGAGLLKLSALLDVSAESCREEVLKWIPNLKRLGIRIELAPGDKGNSLYYLENIYRLCGLESLKFLVVNPQIRSEVAPPPTPYLMFPPSLKKLSLSGLPYPWEYLRRIRNLENLEVLKIKRYAFQGPKWEMHLDFLPLHLKFLLVEDTNLVYWNSTCLPSITFLEHLAIKNCYKLKELPTTWHMFTLKKIEIVDCSAATVAWAEKMQKQALNCKLKVQLSWIADTHRK